MAKSKIISIRIPIDDYYSILQHAAADRQPISAWAHKTIMLSITASQIQVEDTGFKMGYPFENGLNGTTPTKIPINHLL